MKLFQRRLAVSLVSIFAFVFALIFFLLASETGSQLIWVQAKRWIPELHGELDRGTLLKGWTLKQFQYHDPSFDITADEFQASWRLASLLGDEAWIDAVSATKLTVQLRYSNEDVDNSQLEIVNRYLSTPMPLRVNHLSFNEFVYDDPSVKVQIQQLSTGASWRGYDLHIAPSSASNIDVALKPATTPPKTTAAKPSEKGQSNEIEPLPSVFVPFNLSLETFDVKGARYHQSDFDTGVFDTSIAGNFNGMLLNVKQLLVGQNHREIRIDGKMVFQQFYPLEINVSLNSDIPGWLSDSRHFLAHFKGDLKRLAIQSSLEGAEKLSLSGVIQPLVSQLPFEAKAQWSQVPLPEVAKDLRVNQGELSAKGDLKNYQMSLKSLLQWQSYPAMTVKTDLQGDFSQVQFKKLQLDDGKNQLNTTGLLKWSQGLAWQGESDIHITNASAWLPSSEFTMDGQLKQQVKFLKQTWSVDLATANLKGMLNRYPLTVSGHVSGNQNMHWDFDQIAIHSGNNQIDLNGRLAKEWDVAGKIQLPALAAIDRTIQGSISGDFKLKGPEKSPVLSFAANSEKLVSSGVAVRNAKLNGQMTLNDKLPMDVMLTSERVFHSAARWSNLQLSLKGSAASHVARFSVEGKQIAGGFELSGALKQANWSGQIRNLHLKGQAGDWSIQEPLNLSWRNQQMALSAHCWVSNPTRLCFEKSYISANKIRLPFVLTGLNTERLEPWLPSPLEWNGIVAGQGLVGWQAGKPEIDVTFASQKGVFHAETITAHYDQLETKIAISSRNANIHFLFSSPHLGKTEIDAVITDPMHKKMLAGNFNISGLKLDGVAPLVDALEQTKGTINGNGRFGGTLAAPLLYGQFTIENGLLDTATELVQLTDINGRIVVQGDRADMNATMKSGKGSLRINGRTDWPEGQLKGYLNAYANQMDVSFAGYGQGKIDSTLQMTFDPSSAALTGDVTIPWARILVKELPESGVELSDDVQVVRNISTTQAASAPFPFTLDLDLRLGSDVQLDALGLKAKLAGGMRLRQQPAQTLTSAGEIYVVNGRFKAYGQNLVIRSGKLVFNGDLADPYLMAEAIRNPDTMEDSSVTVGVKINSPIQSINAQLFSEPDLPDTDKLSYLIRGRSSTAATNGTTEESMTAMMIGAGLGQANGVVSDVASNFGLQDAGFDTTGSGTDTQVNLSAYLLKNLQIQYGMGVYSAVSEVKLKYFFLPQLYIQAVNSTAQALDLFYKFEF